MGCGLDQAAKNFVEATTTSSPQSCQQLHPFYGTADLATVLFSIMVVMIAIKENIFDRRKQIFQLLSQSKIVELKSSSKWGVLLPNKKGKLSVVQEDSVEVATIHLGLNENLKLKKEIWELSKLKLLKADNPLSEVQVNLVTAVQQKLGLQADLEQLTAHAQKAKDIYELIKGFESDPEIVRRYEDIYLQHSESISQLNISQALQDENIKRLLLFVEIVKFDKENIAVNSHECSETIAETKENYLESVDRVKEYLKLRV